VTNRGWIPLVAPAMALLATEATVATYWTHQTQQSMRKNEWSV